MKYMLFDNNFLVFYAFVLASIIVYSSIPTIVHVAHAKRLFDEPGSRKSHKISVPILGGVAIFSAILISSGLFVKFKEYSELQYVFTASIILFFVGLKDDILIIAPLKKLGGQLIAILIIIILGDLRFTSLHGFLGITHLPYLVSIILSLFVFVVIINGLNLIDGIDGLASGVSILASLVFGFWFYLKGEYGYAIIASAVVGSLIPFFYFNVFGKENKIFMGDTGSLILGLFLACMAVRFNEMNITVSDNYFIHAAPSVSFGILIVPLFDTMRVFLIRLIRGQSPFKADKNHVHHKLLSMGLSHLKATLYILTANVIVIILVLILNFWGIIDLMILIIVTATLLSILPEIFYVLGQRRNNLSKQ